MIKLLLLSVAGLVFSLTGFSETKPSNQQDLPQITVYRSTSCGCCKGWITHLEENGFQVKDIVTEQMAFIKDRFQIPGDLRSCHTGVVGGYTIEGHVPAEDIKRLLREKLQVRGISVPGMVIGSPGMEFENRKDPYAVVSHDTKGKTKVFSRHNF